MGPRSWDRGEPRKQLAPLRTLLCLQWGRGLGTAESTGAEGGHGAGADPSMGPRSWDRGEIYGVMGSGPAPECLQWGRGLGTAESGHNTDAMRAARKPSMGPRSWDRGEHAHAHPLAWMELPFNGAAVLGPRRV